MLRITTWILFTKRFKIITNNLFIIFYLNTWTFWWIKSKLLFSTSNQMSELTTWSLLPWLYGYIRNTSSFINSKSVLLTLSVVAFVFRTIFAIVDKYIIFNIELDICSSFLIFYSLFFYFFFSYFECFKICAKWLNIFLLIQYNLLFKHIYCNYSGCLKVIRKEYLLLWAFASNNIFFKSYVKAINPLMIFLFTPLFPSSFYEPLAFFVMTYETTDQR